MHAALDEFRGTFMQQPPAFSAKKIDGTRSYKLARAGAADARLKPSGDENLPAPASVTAHAIDIVSADGDSVTLRVDCSAGFYVRSLAHDLGQRLGIGGHLAALRRTRSGDFTLEQAISMDTVERDAQLAIDGLIPLAEMLPAFASVTLTAEGVLRATHGRQLGPADTERGLSGRASSFVRLLDQSGQLVGIAEPVGASALLHPSVVLM